MSELPDPSNFVLFAAVFGILPLMVVVGTPFLKISIILFILRNAFATQQVPPTYVINAVAISVAFYIMVPTVSLLFQIAEESQVAFETVPDIIRSVTLLSEPLLEFMSSNTSVTEKEFFQSYRNEMWPESVKTAAHDESFFILVPSFILSELKAGFLLGFLLYIPFVVIDIVVSAILISVGLQTVSPNIITIPLKILLFISVDGWSKLISSLIEGYAL